ncbi:MAG TPA: hypothetical protein VFR34_12585, partial [Paracoccaceae bacterium]|nr:hypothetical protein [Paracoccaceae bacterium]
MPPDPAAFAERGWCRLGPDPALLAWVEHVRPVAAGLARTHRAQWLRAAGTWFAGVNILPNDPSGAVTSGPPLPPGLTARIARLTGFPAWEWDQGQISICHPGYPGRDPAESEAAFRYRRDRDAAHLDGLLAEGTAKRRFLREHHAFLLGIPLTETSPGAAPFVLWEGSHRLMRAAFAEVFA